MEGETRNIKTARSPNKEQKKAAERNRDDAPVSDAAMAAAKPLELLAPHMALLRRLADPKAPKANDYALARAVGCCLIDAIRYADQLRAKGYIVMVMGLPEITKKGQDLLARGGGR